MSIGSHRGGTNRRRRQGVFMVHARTAVGLREGRGWKQTQQGGHKNNCPESKERRHVEAPFHVQLPLGSAANLTTRPPAGFNSSCNQVLAPALGARPEGRPRTPHARPRRD